MATLTVIQSKRQQTGAGLASILAYCAQEFKTVYNGQKLCSGVNCMSGDAFREMMNTKLRCRKTDGRMYYHLVQSFSPEENITPQDAHSLALRFASEQFSGYEVQVSTHVDKDHLHSHFIVNAVSFETGRKYHSDSENIQRLRDASDRLCREQGLSIVESPAPKNSLKRMSAREYRAAEKGQSWKMGLTIQIENAMEYAASKEEFFSLMEGEGYGVRWTPDRKYITYQCPNGMKCRDNTLHELKFTKEMMEYEFRIRAEIARGIADADAPDTARRRKRRPLFCRDRAALEELAGAGTAAQRAAAGADPSERFADDGGSARRSDDSADGSAARVYDGDGGVDGSVSAEAGVGSGSIYERGEDGSLRFVRTGWERERLVFLSAAERALRDEALSPQAVLDLAPAHGLNPVLAYGLGTVAAVAASMDDSSDDPEEQRRRIEAQKAGETVGLILGAAILLTEAVLHHGERQTEKKETVFHQKEQTTFVQLEPEPFPWEEDPFRPAEEIEEDEEPYWLEAEEPQLVL